MFVLDASVTLAWAYPDESSDYADAVQDIIDKDNNAIVPSLWPLEVANGLIKGERQKRITRDDASRFIELLQKAPVEIDPSTPALAFNEITALAHKYGLTAYDAAYLELALRHQLPLATLDEPLAKAAKKCGVEIFRP